MEDSSRKRKPPPVDGNGIGPSGNDDQLLPKKRHLGQSTSKTLSSPQIASTVGMDTTTSWDINDLLEDMLDDSQSIPQTKQLSIHPSTSTKVPPKQTTHSEIDKSPPASAPATLQKPTASSALEFANQLHDTIMAQLACWDECETKSNNDLLAPSPEPTPTSPIKPTFNENQAQQPSDGITKQQSLVLDTPTGGKPTSMEHSKTIFDRSTTAETRIPYKEMIERPSTTAAIKDLQHIQKESKIPLPQEELQPTNDSQQDTQTLRHPIELQPWTDALKIQLDRLKLHTTPPQSPRNISAKRNNNTSTNVLMPRDNVLRMWWYDAYQPSKDGSILLFGKVLEHTTNTYASCCVTVKNVKRTIFVLPRRYRYNEDPNLQTEKITIDDTKNEISQLFDRFHIRDWTCTIRKRKYAFELADVPAESDYLKIQYSFKDLQLPAGITGDTFSHVFGTNDSPMELFLIKRGIKGPQWLEIKDAQTSFGRKKVTWCQYEFLLSDSKQVNVLQDSQQGLNLESPPLSVMSLHLHTIANTKSNDNEIIAASVFMCPKVLVDRADDLENMENSRFVVIRPWVAGGAQWPTDLDEAVQQEKQNGLPIQVQDSEYSLLNYLCGKIHLLDPDVIVGHGFSRLTLDVLLHRMNACNVPFWHKVGRICWKRKPQLQFGPGGIQSSASNEKALLTGRLVCDTMVACRALIQTKSYDLSSLAETQLGIKRAEGKAIITGVAALADKTKTTIQLAKHCWMNSYLAMALLFKFQILPLFKKLTNISGNLWSRSLEGSRMNRNEYLLLHEFHQMKYICPDKMQDDFQGIELDDLVEIVNGNAIKAGKKNQTSYGGGLVLEPKIGLYENFVVLLDFNSLYPSIIQEFNICFTTVDKVEADGDDLLPNLPSPDVPVGVLPRLMKRIVEERKQIKDRMKMPGMDAKKLAQYDIEQNALKLTANSLYGTLGSGFSRFQARYLAAMVTSQGRTILRETVDAVEKQLSMNVVYGDTDSIMVETSECTLENAEKVAKQVQNLINGKYGLLELGIDGYFRRLLILGKKNYASLTVTKQKNESNGWVESIIPKGSSIMRKDVSEVSQYATMRVLGTILSDKTYKKTSVLGLLRKINKYVRSGNVPLAKYALYKLLTKDLDKYVNTNGQTHVQVALKLKKLGHILKAGDTVVYAICLTDDENKATMADKATPIVEVEKGNCKIDYDWYLRHEILPSVTRLCRNVMDTSEFALCLGLEVEKTWSDQIQQQQQQLRHNNLLMQPNKCNFREFKKLDRTTGVRPFKLRCQHCRNQVEIKGYARYEKEEGWVCGMRCPRCFGMMTTANISTQLVLAIRYYIKLYYQGWLHCRELDCDYRTRDCFIHCNNSNGCEGTLVREYTEDLLYSQLLYFDGLFDIKKGVSLNEDTNEEGTSRKAIVDQYGQAFEVLHKTARKYLDRCSYRYVDICYYIVNCDDCE